MRKLIAICLCMVTMLVFAACDNLPMDNGTPPDMLPTNSIVQVENHEPVIELKPNLNKPGMVIDIILPCKPLPKLNINRQEQNVEIPLQPTNPMDKS